MILGYILICGMGIMQPNAVDGCLSTTRLFDSMKSCDEGREAFLGRFTPKPGQYIGSSGCFAIGTKVLTHRADLKEEET
tara:strand:- start:2839 stop:3075 length:237 start_codon:yes stop_codon:yes gene_type:complete